MTQSEDGMRLEEFVRLRMFGSTEEIFRQFKIQFDNEAVLHRNGLPLNEMNSRRSYMACYTNDDVENDVVWNNIKFFWVNGEMKHVVTVSVPIKKEDDTADQHGEEEA